MEEQGMLDLQLDVEYPPLAKREAKTLHKELWKEFHNAVDHWETLDPDERAEWRAWVAAPLPKQTTAKGFSDDAMARMKELATRMQFAKTRKERKELDIAMHDVMKEDGAVAPFSFAMCARYEHCDAESLRAGIIFNLKKLDAQLRAQSEAA